MWACIDYWPRYAKSWHSTFTFVRAKGLAYLSYVVDIRYVWASFILLDAPAELQAQLHYAVKYSRDWTDIQEGLWNQCRQVPAVQEVMVNQITTTEINLAMWV